jgi:hypothetical protein
MRSSQTAWPGRTVGNGIPAFNAENRAHVEQSNGDEDNGDRHTPGPWEVGEHSTHGPQGLNVEPGIALVRGLGIAPAANARLVAAAPELLDALRYLVGAAGLEDRNGKLTEMPKALDNARALIDRLRGEA